MWLLKVWRRYFPRKVQWNPLRTGWPPEFQHQIWQDPTQHIGDTFVTGNDHTTWKVVSWTPSKGGDIDPDDGIYTAIEVVQ